ncbi:3-oxoacyl-[acyl-carrier-protein] reductase FabG [invertebrate metagenome]|uniref:3-oxoacyl-[acyl-carrier-protein] reductase FabG n=1 Tax=invertebrate metagenome TaxID=1711999 RepID=A0A2H9T9J8_9ZZZZ
MGNLDGRVTLVTGASRGIGQGIACELGGQGAVVVGTATTEAGAGKITDWMKQQGIQGRGMVLDVSDPGQCAGLVKQIVEIYGPVQVLVNNAGITRDNILMRMKETEWSEVINTNLGSVFHMSKAVLRGMTKARWGRIINISSVVGSMGNAGQANYAAAKAGLNGFTRAMASEVGSRQITVNAVAPGFIDTDMTRGLPEAHKVKLLEQVALNRLGNVEEIAAAVAFLASDLAGYITGETLHVNGGMYMS